DLHHRGDVGPLGALPVLRRSMPDEELAELGRKGFTHPYLRYGRGRQPDLGRERDVPIRKDSGHHRDYHASGERTPALLAPPPVVPVAARPGRLVPLERLV